MNNQLNFGATSSLSQRQSSRAKLSLQNDVYKEKPYFSIFSFEPSHTSIGYEFHSFTFMHLKKSIEVLTRNIQIYVAGYKF